MDWQHLGDDSWVFGVKIRGLVRHYRGKVYFDEDCDNPQGGWHWMAGSRRGLALSLPIAVAKVEQALGVE